MGVSGWAEWLKTAKNGQGCGPCWVSHGPKSSIGTSLVITGGFDPVGRDHKGSRFDSFWGERVAFVELSPNAKGPGIVS